MPSLCARVARKRPPSCVCDCEHGDGLTTPRGCTTPPSGWQVPSFYAMLVAMGAEEIELQGGRKARRMPSTSARVSRSLW